jgi:hypothetical protein
VVGKGCRGKLIAPRGQRSKELHFVRLWGYLGEGTPDPGNQWGFGFAPTRNSLRVSPMYRVWAMHPALNLPVSPRS